jgi:hypothetical protein
MSDPYCFTWQDLALWIPETAPRFHVDNPFLEPPDLAIRPWVTRVSIAAKHCPCCHRLEHDWVETLEDLTSRLKQHGVPEMPFEDAFAKSLKELYRLDQTRPKP